MDLAVKAAVAGRYQNTGQVCAAAKRFIVEEGIADAFTQRFVAATAALKMGAPDQEENYVGPMARYDLRDELHQQVLASLAKAQPFCWAVRKSRVRVTITPRRCWAMSPLK
jgi:succinate-semialdehyde dehydrogenase